MNGAEYARLFKMAQEARDAALAALAATHEHGKRLDTLEEKVDANATAVAVGRFGLRALGTLGSILIGIGGVLFGLWEWWHGPS
jgi:tetrahydromethanopterin S-methyltransferase subunit G